ncbi:KfrA protein, partial [Verminephrobacter eiseniae]|nr:KfrA protein [Verminephrobacter eiseniae]
QRDAAAAREEAAGLRGQLEAFEEQHTQLMAAFRDSEKADKAVSRTNKD